MTELDCKNGYCHVLDPAAASCLTLGHSKISKWSPLPVLYVLFYLGVFSLFFSSSESMHELFKSRISFHCSSIVFLDVSSIGFLKPSIWVLICPLHNLRVGMVNVELESLTPQDPLRSLHTVEHSGWGVIFFPLAGTISLLPFSVLCLLVEAMFIKFLS